MGRSQQLGKIFAPQPNALHLMGFPFSNFPVLVGIERLLGKEPLLRGSQRARYRPPIELSFDPKFVKQRQRFLRRVDSKDHLIKSSFFERGLPEIDSWKGRPSQRSFSEICGEVYTMIETAKTELKYFGRFQETERIHSVIEDFDSDLGEVVRALDSLGSLERFAVDVRDGVFAPIEEMPQEIMEYRGSEKEISRKTDDLLEDVRFRFKKGVVSLVEEMGMEFKSGIIDFVRGELRSDPEVNNLRRSYESFALPLRLGRYYGRFLDACEKYLPSDSFNDWEIEAEELIIQEVPSIPEATYPSFGDHYDISSLFPPKLMRMRRIDGRSVPIDFETSPDERKFLIAGLHSGGKSFFLENIVAASIIAQMGLALPAERITLPSYERIFYFKDSGDLYRPGMGSLETQLESIEEITRSAGERDLVVIDEFLDSASPEIASHLGPIILGKLMASEATVFVTSHRDTEYSRLSREGWTLMSPDYDVVGGIVKPNLKIKRGPPEKGINQRYIMQRYEEYFS